MTDTTIVAGLIIIAYLIGGIPLGVLVGRARGVDIRQYGSGNIGASNVLRLLGAKAGILVWLADVLKGAVPVAGARFALIHSFGMNRPELGLSLVALGAVLGHCFSPYLKLSGGRGVSTSLGALLAIDWRVGLLVFGAWLVVITISRYISLASILAAASSPLVFALYGDSRYYMMLGVVLAIILIERHRPNIGRLLAGSETKIGQKAKPQTDDDDQQQ